MHDVPGSSSSLVGRDEETRLLQTALTAASGGDPRAVFVLGEAGVGKTALVRAAAGETSRDGGTVLWAPCLRFAAAESTLLPLVLAFERWRRDAENSTAAAVLASVPGAEVLLPALGGHGAAGPVSMLPVVAALLDRLAQAAPTVLVVDDLQWADPATRDALAFVVAGFRHQRLAVLATYRSAELAAGDPLLGWLADVRRLPGVEQLRLGRLGAPATAEQVSLLLGEDAHPALAAEVFRRSEGNPYLSELLVAGLDPTSEALPDDLPDELTDVLLAAWHRLPASARTGLQVLAVAGRPVTVAELAETCAAVGAATGPVPALVADALAQGVLVRHDQLVWFRHPLLAETLTRTTLPGETGPWHAAWARVLEREPASGMAELRRLGALALHHEAAGDLPAARAVSRSAADLSRELRAPREEAAHLRRLVRLTPPAVTPSERTGLLDVLERAGRSSLLVGEGEESAALLGRALQLVDEDADPARASRLLIAYGDTAWHLGRLSGQPLDWAHRAVGLARRVPERPELPLALAALAECALWAGQDELGRQAADEAVEAARGSRSAEARSTAYGARAFARPESSTAEADTLRALHYAWLAADPDVRAWATVGRANFLEGQGRSEELVGVLARGRREALAGGATAMAMFLGAALARDLIDLGRLEEARRVTGESLSLTGVANGAASVRLSAAALAVRAGRPSAAEQHVRRARELIPELDVRPGLEAPPILAEVMLAQRRETEALRMLLRTMPSQAVDSRIMDDMVLWGTRAAADVVDRARDRSDIGAAAGALALLDELEVLRGRFPGEPYAPGSAVDRRQPAVGLVVAVERERTRGPVAVDRWLEAAAACGTAELRWEQHRALLMAAGVSVRAAADRATTARLLREVHAFARTEYAETLRARAEELARIGRVPLAEPRPPEQPSGTGARRLDGLTRREREVLGHLVAGRTYAEIATALFISEKTVSVHVSNLLRKTGTSSRQEAATLAVDLGAERADR